MILTKDDLDMLDRFANVPVRFYLHLLDEGGEITATYEELAKRIGCSRYSIYTMIHRFVRLGKIKVERSVKKKGEEARERRGRPSDVVSIRVIP